MSATTATDDEQGTGTARTVARVLLGVALAYAGLAHLFWSRDTFQAQVPDWVPLDADLVVVLSGIVEIALGAALLFLRRRRALVGWVVAAFFVAVFPGNISQFVDGDAAFGLDSDLARGVRLLFQPLLVVWALWCTGAWATWRACRRA
ncbi:MAG: DoxX family membrane protein [Acidimicrobiales bacterium]|nr:DoxX family membrane protein [Acidimicrobiales bacterium]